MKVGLEIGGKKEDEKKADLEAPLGEFGVHVWTDRHFDRRLEKNLEQVGNLWTETEINAFKDMSVVKKNVLRRANRMYGYLSENVPHGRALENPRLSDAVRAINDLLLMAQNAAFSDWDDEDVALITNDYFARCHDIVWHTFDTKNTTVTKAFTIQQAIPSSGAKITVEPKPAAPT